MITPSSSSRYHGVIPIVGDGVQYFPTLFDRPQVRVSGERLHVVSMIEEKRPDLISGRYGSPDEWWTIMEHNNVVDPLTLRDGDNLRIPLFTLVGQPQVRMALVSVDDEVVPESSDVPPSMIELGKVPSNDTIAKSGTSTSTTGLIQFTIQRCVIGAVHYELQVSINPEFSTIILGRLSLLSLDRWFCLQDGSYQQWPVGGIINPQADVPAYFSVQANDPMVKGGRYFFRARPIIDANGVITYGRWGGGSLIL